MRILIQMALLAAVAPPFALAADPAPAVVSAVQKVFDAMAAKDTVALRGAFLPDARLVSVGPDGRVNSTAAADWAARIGGITDAILERMWSPRVLVDGRMATLWAPYDFHRAGKFSHCGIDTVTLIGQQGEWKVTTFAYTVKREGCGPSPLGPPKP
jgi:hypothetical protein